MIEIIKKIINFVLNTTCMYASSGFIKSPICTKKQIESRDLVVVFTKMWPWS